MEAGKPRKGEESVGDFDSIASGVVGAGGPGRCHFPTYKHVYHHVSTTHCIALACFGLLSLAPRRLLRGFDDGKCRG